jgi:hypothetical protein
VVEETFITMMTRPARKATAYLTALAPTRTPTLPPLVALGKQTVLVMVATTTHARQLVINLPNTITTATTITIATTVAPPPAPRVVPGPKLRVGQLPNRPGENLTLPKSQSVAWIPPRTTPPEEKKYKNRPSVS